MFKSDVGALGNQIELCLLSERHSRKEVNLWKNSCHVERFGSTHRRRLYLCVGTGLPPGMERTFSFESTVLAPARLFLPIVSPPLEKKDVIWRQTFRVIGSHITRLSVIVVVSGIRTSPHNVLNFIPCAAQNPVSSLKVAQKTFARLLLF